MTIRTFYDGTTGEILAVYSSQVDAPNLGENQFPNTPFLEGVSITSGYIKDGQPHDAEDMDVVIDASVNGVVIYGMPETASTTVVGPLDADAPQTRDIASASNLKPGKYLVEVDPNNSRYNPLSAEITIE